MSSIGIGHAQSAGVYVYAAMPTGATVVNTLSNKWAIQNEGSMVASTLANPTVPSTTALAPVLPSASQFVPRFPPIIHIASNVNN